ncbi:MAG: IS5 family transposase [Nevskiaceae bacterium]|nr:MAG: IS5 family transposase [Nevskiaceae bacterium]TBR72205.1 MAG: IS5 family transposase [Nevskiaceae bacterium]
MPQQLTFATESDASFETHRKTTRRDVFLAEMDKVVPSAKLCAAIEPFYPKPRADGGGRPSIGLERMLRIHFLQQWYALSDPAVEEALYDSVAMRRFVGIDLGREAAPDETTVCKFRHLLEKHGLADRLFAAVSEHLKRHGMKLSQGTLVDATLIAAAPSTKNKAKARDPEMHQTRKGNQWYFGMKAHIGVDEGTGLVHTVVSTAANVADVTEVGKLLHGREKRVFGDAGYIGAEKRAPKRGRQFWIAAKRSTVKAIEDTELREVTLQLEHAKASMRATVEHPFRVLKRQFGYVKARYQGLAKNAAQITTLFALVNLWMTRKHLLQPA